jgi:hypothetical protein
VQHKQAICIEQLLQVIGHHIVQASITVNDPNPQPTFDAIRRKQPDTTFQPASPASEPKPVYPKSDGRTARPIRLVISDPGYARRRVAGVQ